MPVRITKRQRNGATRRRVSKGERQFRALIAPHDEQQFRELIAPLDEAERTLLLGGLMVINRHGLRRLVRWVDFVHTWLHQRQHTK